MSEYLDVFIENLLKSRLFDFLLLNAIIFRGDYHLALQCGIDRSYLGRIERGEVNITIKKLYEIALALDTDPKNFLP
ncbi:helix-turn-helix domain-containing protein [Acinetobacter baumannii]|uniref:helix-turn-helix domain-containing protein n=1 Tax=Acinetobacter baumannii TaxID=470 RepID=UPI001CF7BB12|nr:helix-turn-helix transcriptional regulator [Acinetobacter baumannii]MCI3939796.1 helix-turn-helix domain-containing protein [Acinetobacter baumannii]MDG9794140.1 helix-turn-helix domain-containing protein [Acinetobacter baumannii]MDU4059632.1 helix-turn-helix transcriptional regulator [Acinetobacter baumannii]MDU7562462.1 helix-turn-helix transcriptional regulator [Acinetobacter baumannii]MDV4304972.1 helix-turn-helix domain-containing protein [Acinetobacter baumannii]